MAGLAKYLIAAGALWGGWARAEGDPPPPAGLSDADLLKLSQGEAIEIYDERPDKPFDRDTEVRLTGEELAARGAVDLKTALALIPDVTVRESGRGGFQIDVRGARKGEVAVWIDGVLVSDPWYGTFDVTSIPITDIVQIRVATTPQSPIDGGRRHQPGLAPGHRRVDPRPGPAAALGNHGRAGRHALRSVGRYAGGLLAGSR